MISLRSWTAELMTALVLLAAIVALVIQTLGFAPSPVRGYPGAAFFPQIALVGAGIFVVLWLAILVRRRMKSMAGTNDNGVEFGFEWRDYFITIGAVLAFVYGLDLVGFEISCFLLLFLLLYSRAGNVITAFLMAAVTTLVLYGTFVLLLNVSLPVAFLPRFLSF